MTDIDTSSGLNPGSRFYTAYSIKRNRRTKVTIEGIRERIVAILTKDHPQTVRQVFYALTVSGAVVKIEREYQGTVVRLLTRMRETGRVPFDWISDNTRWQRKPTTFTSPGEFMHAGAEGYRRDLWASNPVRVEIWCEKDALAGVLIEETDPYDVPLMVARGYSSVTFLHASAKQIESIGKPTYIYHAGDLDPSGVDSARDIEAKLRRYAPSAEIHFERIAVTRQQADEWNLPTRPTKAKDPRAKKFSGTSVELDAIPAHRLRELVRGCIERHIDPHHIEMLRIAEASERELITRWAALCAGERS